MDLLNFDKEEKGYEKLYPTRTNFKANIGKKICYVDFVEPHRGTYFVRYGIIANVRYSQLVLEGERYVDIRDIKECGIETNKP